MISHSIFHVAGCAAAVCLLAACVSYNASRYGDRTIDFAPAEQAAQRIVVPVCDPNGDIKTQQANPACIGKTLRAANGQGGTITFLKPGVAVPVANIDADMLAPPGQ